MAVNTAQMVSLIDARLKEVFFESKGDIPEISTNVVRTKNTTRRYEIVSGVVGVPEAQEVPEGGVYQSKEIKIRPNTIIEMKKFGFIINVTRELIMDNLFQPVQDDVAQAMRNSMTQTRERRSCNLINNGWTTQTTYDGVTLFNTAHPLLQGGTQSNAASVGSAFDVDSFWEGVNIMQTTQDNSTLYASIYAPKWLVGNQQLQRKFNEVIRSEWLPYVTANTENVLRSLYDVQPLVSPLISSTTSWSMYADPAKVISYGLTHWNREALSINTLFNVKGDNELGAGVDRDIYTWRCRERYEDATTHWIGTYGNVGA